MNHIQIVDHEETESGIADPGSLRVSSVSLELKQPPPPSSESPKRRFTLKRVCCVLLLVIVLAIIIAFVAVSTKTGKGGVPPETPA